MPSSPARAATAFWLGLACFFGILLYILGEALTPFFVGLILAYMLDPLVDRVQRHGLSRGWATLSVAFGITLFFLGVGLLLVPVLVNEFLHFISSLPELIKTVQRAAHDAFEHFKNTSLGQMFSNVHEPFNSITSNAGTLAAQVLNSVWNGGQALLNTAALLLITPIVTCYLLYDWDRLVAHIDHLLPRASVKPVRALAREVDRVFASFFRGQALICVILGIGYACGLSLIGLNFALLLGIGAGLIAFVPYLGNLVGIGTTLLVSIAQFGFSGWHLGLIACVFALGQLLDGYVLQPWLLGRAIGLHPVVMIFALYAFGHVFGFFGVVLAVPAAAALGVGVRHVVANYQRSAYYGAPDSKSKLRKS